MSSISDFTARPDGGKTSTTISAFPTPSVKPPRPKPRPIKKKTAATAIDNSSHISTFTGPGAPQQSTSRQATNGATDFGGELLDFTASSSIADRAKTRQRKQPGPSIAQEWDEDDFMIHKPKQKAKASAEPDYMLDEQPRKAKTAKGKRKAGKVGDVLEISSDDEDELFLKRSTTKPKPTSSPRTSSSLQPTELITKPPRPRPRPVTKRSKGTTEEPTSNPASDNRASTPANTPPDTDLLSSHSKGCQNNLSSLPPSDPPIPTAHTNAYSVGLPAIETLPQPPSSNGRKTPAEFDELFSGDDDLFGPEPVAQLQDLTKLPPPPTFFAGSSSQVNPSGGETSTVQAGDALDLNTLPIQNPEKDAKPKAKRKKKAVDEDDGDGDWGAVSCKPKEKKAPKKKRAMAQVEVVITTKPPVTGKADKGKKKKKDDEVAVGPRQAGKTKEVFKSRETIEDSDEDPLMESYRPEETAAASLSPPGGHSSTDKPLDASLAPKGRSTEPTAYQDDDMGLAEDDVAPVAQKDSRRKRKSTVVDDEEDFHEGPSRNEQSSNKRQKKEKQARQEDASDGQAANPAMFSSRKQKGKAKAAMIVSENEEEPAPPGRASFTRNEEEDEPDLPKVR